jgi:hypothetical protein
MRLDLLERGGAWLEKTLAPSMSIQRDLLLGKTNQGFQRLRRLLRVARNGNQWTILQQKQGRKELE